MKKLLILSFATCHALLNAMEPAVPRPAFPTTPKGCFDIPSSQFLSNPTPQSRQAQRVMHALNLFHSLKNAYQTSPRQKEAIENILAAWQLYLDKHRADYPELSSYTPEISHYKPETDLTKVRRTANTALWTVLGKDYEQKQINDHSSYLQIRATINNLEAAAAPNSLSPQSKKKVKDLREIRKNMQTLGTTQRTLPQMLFERSQSGSSVVPASSSSSSGTTPALSSSSSDSRKRSSDSDLIDAKRQKNNHDETGDKP